jgi:hypothetical protein
MRKLSLLAASAFALSAIAVALPGNAAPKPTAARFGAPVKVTPANGYGYEPTVISDRFGNLYATAHKENWQLAVAPDARATQQVRSMSWSWWSSDNGKTWKNLPTGPGDVYSHNVGDEGDMAVDDAGYMYFADMNVHDVTFTAYKADGRGEVRFEHHLPLAAFAEPVDDRPWITAHGNGVVMYLGNMGNKAWYKAGQPPLGGKSEAANGPGRYTVYMSYDHGRTWDHTGYTLADSGWCRPAADHRKGSKTLYVVCGNDEDKLYSYVSNDDGKSWKRYDMGSYVPASTDSYPTVEVAKDGTIYALHVSKGDEGELLKLYTSKTKGATWKVQNITPRVGTYVYSWLAVAPNGKLGLGTYYRAAKGDPWKVYGAIWTPGQRPVLTSLDDKNPVAAGSAGNPPGDFLTSGFSPDSKLNIVWTRVVGSAAGVTTIERDIYFARSL